MPLGAREHVCISSNMTSTKRNKESVCVCVCVCVFKDRSWRNNILSWLAFVCPSPTSTCQHCQPSLSCFSASYITVHPPQCPAFCHAVCPFADRPRRQSVEPVSRHMLKRTWQGTICFTQSLQEDSCAIFGFHSASCVGLRSFSDYSGLNQILASGLLTPGKVWKWT